MNPIAVFGLAADPPTLGHEVAAMAVYAQTGIFVWMMPCYQHPFAKNMTDPIHRERMCVRATGKGWGNTIGFEIENKLTCCTFDVMKDLREHNPGFDLHVVIGMDNANIIEKEWQHGEEFIHAFPFIVVGRPNCEPSCDWFMRPPHQFVDVHWPISSTDVRAAIARGDNYFAQRNVSREVWDYIREERLYGYKR